MENPIDTDAIRGEVAFNPDKDGRYFDFIHELCDEVERLRAEIDTIPHTTNPKESP
jgi:hypothetical protein